MNGFINLLKPPGLTSHTAVSKMRRLLGIRAIGHGGTLDPAASGVLPLAVGQATRLLEHLVAQDKAYIGEVTFGVATDTLDQEGQVTWQAARPPVLDLAQIEVVLAAMIGPREQVPPAYSAIKYQGRPLYEYARAGKIVQVPARPITVYSLSIKDFRADPWPRLLFHLRCSKGTYVRSLVQEVAEQLGTQGTLTFLLREQVGDFSVQNALTLEEIHNLAETGHVAQCLLPSALALRGWPQVNLELATARRFLQGQRIRLDQAYGDVMVAVYQADRLLGVGRIRQGVLAPQKVLAKWEELSEHDHHTRF